MKSFMKTVQNGNQPILNTTYNIAYTSCRKH